MSKSIGRLFTLTKRNILEIIRDPLSLMFTILVPLLMEILFYLIFHKLTPQFQMKYLAPGIVVFSQGFLTLFSGLLISTDKNTSFLTRLYVSKAKSYEFILGYALSILPITLIQSTLFFVVGGLFDTSMFSVNMIFAILISVVTSIFFIACGILFGSLCNEKSIGGVASIVIMGQSLLSGMWFPLEGLSDGMLNAMKVLPFKNATLLVQNISSKIPVSFDSFWLPLIIVIAYSILMLAIAIIVFKQKMKAK